MMLYRKAQIKSVADSGASSGAGLNSSVRTPRIDLQERERLVIELLRGQEIDDIHNDAKRVEAFDAYFEVYLRHFKEALAGQEEHHPDRNNQDIVNVASLICDQQTKERIVRSLDTENDSSSHPVHIDVLKRTVELSARILTMHETSKWDSPGQSHPAWKDEETLQDCLNRFYSKPQCTDTVVFERSFDARALERIAGFEIIWTDNLAEHLSMHDNGNNQTLCIFHHATYLKAMSLEKQQALFPDNLLSETLNTLALLFPYNDSATRRWFQKKCAKEESILDRGILRCKRLRDEQRQIDQFFYWRDRLVMLKQEFDMAEPSTVAQWWNDRRNRVVWATFWVAAMVLFLTVFFGCIQSIEGGLQVYKAYHPS